jgi:hypothetical protein
LGLLTTLARLADSKLLGPLNFGERYEATRTDGYGVKITSID